MDLSLLQADWQERMQDFSDRWNPMLVREIRRLLKSRAFAITFLLLVSSATLSSYFMVAQAGASIRYLESGRNFCSVFLFVLSFPLFFVVPLSLFSVAAQEHQEETLETLSITTLKTEDILRGYLTCGFAHMLFYLCALLPYISFSYLLRGLGVLEVLGGLGVVLLFTFVMMYWGTMLGTCSRGPISRGICGILTVLGGVVSLAITSTMNNVVFSGEAQGPELLGGLICFFFILTPCMVIMYAVARQQLLLVDPMLQPYRVLLNEEGKVVKFIPPSHGLYVDAPAWMNPSMSERSPSPHPAPKGT